jgi:hypothetical protein
MEIEIYQIVALFLLAITFGVIARSLTFDEEIIFKKRKYFLSFKILIAFLSIIYFFNDKKVSLILFSILIMVFVWDLKIPNWRKK